VGDTQTVHELMPFTRLLGMEMVRVDAGEVTARLEHRPELCTSGGVLHGGAVMALADSTGAMCALQNLPEGAGTSTIESKTNFLRPLRSGHALAVSRPLHVGRTVIVVETEISDPDGRIAAKVIQTQAVLRPS